MLPSCPALGRLLTFSRAQLFVPRIRIIITLQSAFICLKDLMQIQSYLDFVKPNCILHSPPSPLPSFSCWRFVDKPFRVRILLHALHIATFGFLHYSCVHNIHSSADVFFFFSTRILALLKKTNPEQTTNSSMMHGLECPVTFVCSRQHPSFIVVISGPAHIAMRDLFLPEPQLRRA